MAPRALEARLLFAQFAFAVEEFRQDFAAFVGQDTAEGFAAVVESRVIEKLVQGYDGSGFGVERAVDDARNSALEDCPCAHRTGFEGHEQRALEQSPGV